MDLCVVIPAFNRASLLPRAVASCLPQLDSACELVIVDDASTDNTPHLTFPPPVRLLRLNENRGQGAARNAGAAATTAEWLVSLDSDDELLPGAISAIRAAIAAHPSFHRHVFSYRRDDGRLSPWPALTHESLDYPGYCRWMEHRSLYDLLMVTRRSTFDEVRYPSERWSDHALYQLDFARRFSTLAHPEPLALVHTDAHDRVSDRRRSSTEARQAAAELAPQWDTILARHGDALRQHAPRTFEMYRRMRAANLVLAGRRGEGLRGLLQCALSTPALPEAWMLLAAATAPRPWFSALRSLRRAAT